MEWVEQRRGGSRELTCKRPSGYEASIVVTGREVTARLSKAREDNTFVPPAEALAAGDLEQVVTRLRAELESRIETLEDGHS
jgi:hypothetical protein